MRDNNIFKLILFLVILLITTKSAYTAEKFFLSADSIIKNDENKTIKAEGNVNLTNNQYKLKANEITYYLKEKKVSQYFYKKWTKEICQTTVINKESINSRK